MKKILSFIFLLASAIVNAQNALPNPGFENWTTVGTRMDPNNWNTLNPNTAVLGILTCTKAIGADVHSGSAAIKLITKNVLGQTANGLATTGNIAISPPGVSGGISYTGRPDSIVGWYKYSSVNGDNGFVEFQLLGSSTTPDTIGYVRFVTPNSSVGSYTRFSAPINYRSSNAVTKSIWIISSSGGFTGSVNSTLYIDDLELITNTSTVIKKTLSNEFFLSPNPVKDLLNISSFGGMDFDLFDVSGKKILSERLHAGNNQLSLELLSNGIYFYSIHDKAMVQKGKIQVAH